jgi:hypothetical protein
VRSFALLAAFAGCYSPKAQAGAPCGVGHACPSGLVCSAASQTCELHDIDASVPIDAPTIDAPTTVCFGTGIVQVCLPQPQGTVAFMAASSKINTDTDPACAVLTSASQPDLCVIAANTIQVATTVKVTGSRPLVLVAVDGVTISGVLDGSSVDNSPGPGANPASCAAGTAAAASTGGYGGSFGGVGGNGGGTGGGTAPAATPSPTTLRGGCPSGDGGIGVHGVPGGGAVYVIAKGSIMVNGTINASGDAGEAGGPITDGGSGGGSGGMIGLDAPMVSVAGQLFANGGGGGEGGVAAPATSSDGQVCTAALDAAQGGAGSAGGDGGNGSAGTALDGTDGLNGGANGDGGGGGGTGVIKIYATTRMLSANVSPAPS